MANTPTDNQPGFRAEEPEHCHACAHHHDIYNTLASAEKRPGRINMQEEAGACQVSRSARVNTK